MRFSTVIVALCASTASAYTSSSFMGGQSATLRTASRSSSRSGLRMETFGFDFAEDAAAVALGENSKLLGEKRLKEQFIPEQQKRSLLTDDYPVLERAGELNLLTLTAKSGLLSALDEKGLTLSDLEKLLPVAEKLGLLQILKIPQFYNLLVPVLVEPAPLLIGPAVAVVKAPAALWTGLAAVFLALEANGVASSGEVSIPLLIPVVLFGGLGSLLGGSVGIPDVSGVEAPTVAKAAPAAKFTAPSAPSFSAPSLPSFGGGDDFQESSAPAPVFKGPKRAGLRI